MLKKLFDRFRKDRIKWGKIFSLLCMIQYILIAACSTGAEGDQFLPTPGPEYVDKSLLAGEYCDPPCWHGLILDQSSSDEVISVVESLSFIDSESFRMTKTYLHNQIGEIYGYNYQYPENQGCCSFWISGGTLSFITIRPNYHLPFSEVIEVLGEPDFVSIFRDPGECILQLTWKELRISIKHDVDQRECTRIQKDFLIDPSYQVEKIVYESLEGITQRELDSQSGWEGFIQE